MDKINENQYALRANISQEAIKNVKRIRGQFAAAGTEYTIPEVIDYILKKATKK